jgi:hypothetical protein
LLLDAASASSATLEHLERCSGCASQLNSLKSTISLLDEWQAPDPSLYFDSRLYARLRAEQARRPAGFFERMHAWILYGAQYRARQWVALAITLLTIGGGSVVFFESSQKPAEVSAAIQDLEWYDGNAQIVEQLSSFDPENQSAPVEAR